MLVSWRFDCYFQVLMQQDDGVFFVCGPQSIPALICQVRFTNCNSLKGTTFVFTKFLDELLWLKSKRYQIPSCIRWGVEQSVKLITMLFLSMVMLKLWLLTSVLLLSLQINLKISSGNSLLIFLYFELTQFIVVSRTDVHNWQDRTCFHRFWAARLTAKPHL